MQLDYEIEGLAEFIYFCLKIGNWNLRMKNVSQGSCREVC